MTIVEAAQLISPGIEKRIDPALWADLGCGSGAFTKALATCLAPGSKIYAVDKERQSMKSPNHVEIDFFQFDFIEDELPFSNLDGLLLANSLHYVQDKLKLFDRLSKLLKVEGQIIIVEYDTQRANEWVPYPVSFQSLLAIVSEAGYHKVIKIGERDSVYNAQKMYACTAKRR